MRLKSIKLAGFKSFVDPTTVNFPSNLCAVVGPNGCGKSNIIDAVRWVMGESSAKNLRGESMTDVIFKGSSNRKPVGQASVELIFDNSDKTITGEYASFSEISIRRIVNNEAQSTYILNGTKCRRRDITDIFLGTGLGPRSYSIIEQGMVSRLIESKPEELRVFIEEAAGISKYKERRRETENRIKRTKENLERLSDIRDELGRQLHHLQRQAKAAEKYKEYKQEERDTHAQLNAVRWQTLDIEVNTGQQLISELDLKLEACVANYRGFEADIEKQREEGVEFNEKYQTVQASFYSLGGEISRIEQNIEHQRQRQQQLEEELRSIKHGLSAAQLELEQDLDKITALDEEASNLEPELDGAKLAETESSKAQEGAEEAMTKWQQEWDRFNGDSAESTRNAEVEQQRINHLENIVERGIQRKAALAEELNALGDEPEAAAIISIEANINKLGDKQTALETRNNSLNEKIETGRQTFTSLNNDLNQYRSQLQSLLGRQSSLEALQQAALGKKEGSTLAWLENNKLALNSRLVDDLKADKGWEQAVETVLGEHLQAVCVDNLDSLKDVLESFSDGQLDLMDTSSSKNSSSENAALAKHKLTDKVSSKHNLGSLVDGIFCAESLAEGLSLRQHLNSHESIITRQGIWLGASWLRVSKGFDEKAGMIQRQDELSSLTQAIQEEENTIAELVKTLERQQEQLQNLEQEKDQFLQELSELTGQLTELSSERSAKLMKVEQETQRRQRLRVEITDLEKQLLVEQENIASSRVNLQTALDRMEADTSQRETLLQGRDSFRSELDLNRQKARHDKDHTHQLSLRHQTLLAQLNSLKSVLDRVNSQVSTYELRKSQVEENLNKSDDPIPVLKQELEEKLASRVSIESQLTEAKANVDATEHSIRELEGKRNESQEKSQSLRDELASKRLGIEGSTVKRAALEDQLKAASYDLEAVLKELSGGLTETEFELSLEKLSSRIQRLGPINLAAIDEYSTQSERKIYLDQQDKDLVKALTTLENAIKKIDRETRTRFKETFDKINNSLQDLFPKVFGGGHAYLDMVGEDLLDTGVAIMARPPGKRNSTIHLLSGGEKAMTAIALVFSIFRLNPSPFCMLDEVDAPLDDANVGRYANLVAEMSDIVQFIFITHNRLTMETANQLLGVTMHEPGVSRLVAVDVDEAAELAAM